MWIQKEKEMHRREIRHRDLHNMTPNVRLQHIGSELDYTFVGFSQGNPEIVTVRDAEGDEEVITINQLLLEYYIYV